MNQTQKNCIKFWTKLSLIVAGGIFLFIGMLTGNEIALVIVAILSIAFFAYVIAIWIAQRVYLWRIMGVCDPQEWKIVKWYKFSLLNGGPNYIINLLAHDEEPCMAHIAIFEKIANQVKIPKILLDNSDNP